VARQLSTYEKKQEMAALVSDLLRFYAQAERHLFCPDGAGAARASADWEESIPDAELLAVQGFESCARCWAAEEECSACEGTGIFRG
jgi:hypothetical protein